MSLALELGILLILILANGVFSLAEIAVVAVRSARLEAAVERGDKKARAVLRLKESPDRFLSTVQVGITLVGIIAGAYGGAAFRTRLAAWLSGVGFGAYADEAAFVVVVGAITYLSVVVGELVPKRIALAHAEGAAKILAQPMRLMARMAAPLIWLLTRSSGLLLAALRVNPAAEEQVTEDEIRRMLEQGADVGVLEPGEHVIVERVLAFTDRRAATMMTPRTQIVWVDANAPLEDSLQVMSRSPHSYFLACDGAVDRPLGTVSAKELWRRQIRTDEPLDLRSTLAPVPHIPEAMPALKLLEELKRSGQHLAVVLDEHGGVSGLITLHDLMEALVGELPNEDSGDEEAAVERADGSWLLDGGLAVADMVRILNIDAPAEAGGSANTVAGLVLACLGRFPKTGERLEWSGLRFEVLDMDGHRIDRVLAKRIGEGRDGDGDA